MKDLYQEYGDDFVCISWYLNAGYQLPEGTSKFSWYGFGGTPSAMFDGTEDVVGGASSGSMYGTYSPIVQSRFNVSSPVELIATYSSVNDEASVTATINATENIPSGSYEIEFVVIENEAHDQINMARQVLASEPLTISNAGQSQVVSRSFTLDPSWIEDNVRVVVFIQNQSGVKSILQATYSVADYVGTIVIDAQPNGLGAPWNLTGPEGLNMTGAGDANFFLFYEGDYTLTWLPVEHWTLPTPASTTQTLVTDGEIGFSGQYEGGIFTLATDIDIADTGSAQGVAAVDYDNDGDIDVHVIRNGSPDMLLQNDNGIFTDIADGFLADQGDGRAATWADYDNDGDMDAYLSKNNEANVLLTNDDGVFSNVTLYNMDNSGPGRGVSWVDYDHDGKLDLYVVNEDAENKLFLAYGDPGIGQWIFLAGSSTVADAGPGINGCWADYNGDGSQDLYLTNYLQANVLWDNNPEYGFFDVTGTGSMASISRGTGVAWGDYDNDGDMDIYFANDSAIDILCNNSASTFSQVSDPALSSVDNTKSVSWGDYDNDGDLDLYVSKYGAFDRILRNDNGSFSEVAIGWDETGGFANGMAWADFNNDGKLDIFIANDGDKNALMLNNIDNGNHWLKVKLVGDTTNKSAVGARITIVADGVTMIREVNTSTGYFSQGPLVQHFGLGAAEAIDLMTITWPGEESQTVAVSSVDQLVTVYQGGAPSDVEDLAPTKFALHQCYPNPFNPSTTISYDLPQNGDVTLKLYDVSGSLVRTLKSGQPEEAGSHSVVWNGLDDNGHKASAGIYFCKMQSGQYSATVRMMMVK